MEPTINKKKNSSLWIVLAVILVVSIAAIIIIVTYSNSPAQRYLRQLEVADRYLEDLDYEQAVAAYQAAIEIDPRQPDAYLGLAEAYVGMGDYEAALKVLEEGYRLTQDSRIAEKMEEIEALLNPVEDTGSEPATEEGTENVSEEADAENEWNDEFAELETMIDERWQDLAGRDNTVEYLRSREELKEEYAPLIAKAEKLVSNYTSEDPNSLDGDVKYNVAYIYSYLRIFYLGIGDMENSKHYNLLYKQLYPDADYNQQAFYNDYGLQITQYVYSDGNNKIYSGYEKAIEGMELICVSTWGHNEYGQCIRITNEHPGGDTDVWIYSYDDSGRLISQIQRFSYNNRLFYEEYFDYLSSDEVVRRTKWSDEDEWEEVTLSIDKWGYGHLIE